MTETFVYAPCTVGGCETELRIPPGEPTPDGWACPEHRHDHQETR